MAAFIKLEDSPMFQKQVCTLEEAADELKDRCQKLYKGTKNFVGYLAEACNADNAFAECLEAFGGGLDDPVSVSLGGPVISKFINAFRELASHKELLRTQVEHVLLDRLMHFMTVDLQEAKESRRYFDKAIYSYDQAREKYVSLKKNTRGDIVAELEEDLENSKSAFERSRFNLVHALMNIEAKKKYEFLESISATMDAHLRYFKLGYDLLSQLEPFIHQILTYAQQSKEQATIEQDRLAKRIQEFRTQSELDHLRASVVTGSSENADGIRVVGMNSYRNTESVLQPVENKQTIKQGYLLKRSSSLRTDWKRRFFVLDNQGTLYYYRNKGAKPLGFHHHYSGSAEHGSGVLSRFRSRHSRSASLTDDNLGCRIIDLRTSMIKMDAADIDLRLCFRIISPQKTYTLQAENGADRMDWVNKITAVITCLLNSHFLKQPSLGSKHLDKNYCGSGSSGNVSPNHNDESGEKPKVADDVPRILKEIPGNDVCAECCAPEPDWASLNLGVLMCIECSGVHRNLGVHISKVRSLTLDVKVWEPTILELFRNLGNTYCNSLWEGLLYRNERADKSNAAVSKPSPKDTFYVKEKYIQAKYMEKVLVVRDSTSLESSHAKSIWQAVQNHNLREVYRLIVVSDTRIINTDFDDVVDVDLYHHDINSQGLNLNGSKVKRRMHDPAACERIMVSKEPKDCLQGCSLLHLACHCGDPVMLELLLQFGADINMRDFHGRTPLHHCIASGNNTFAKILMRRGARPSIKDGGGLSSLERAMEMGAITDEELFILLAES